MDFQPYDDIVEKYVQRICKEEGNSDGIKSIVIEIMQKAHEWGEQAVWAFRAGKFVDDATIECGDENKPVYVDAETGRIIK